MQAQALVRRGMDVYVLLHSYSTIRNQKQSKSVKRYRKASGINFLEVHSYLLPKVGIDRNRKWMSLQVKRKVKKLGIDLIHHHGILDKTYLTLYLSEKLGIPFVLTEHSPFDEKGKVSYFDQFTDDKIVERFLSKAKLRLAVSKFYARLYERKFREPFDVLYNLVSDDFLKENHLSNRAHGHFVFTAIGNLEPIKNHKLLLEAFEKVKSSDPDVKLNLVGTGSLKDELMSYAQQLGLSHSVEFLGHLSREQINHVLNQSDVLVISSNKETFGVVAVEAFFVGIPVVSTKCGGPEELIDERNGHLVEVNNVESLKNGMIEIKTNYRQFKKEQIQELAVHRFSEKSVLDNLIRYYDMIKE